MKDKLIKSIQFAQTINGSLKKVNNYSGLVAHVRSIVDNGTVRTETYEDD